MFYVDAEKTCLVYAHGNEKFSTWSLCNGGFIRDTLRQPLPDDLELEELNPVEAPELGDHFGDLLTTAGRWGLDSLATRFPRGKDNIMPEKKPQDLNKLIK